MPRLPFDTLNTKKNCNSQSRSILWWRRRLLAFLIISATPESFALHLREGWVRGEERGGGSLSDAGQLVGGRPKTWVGMRVLQQKVQSRRIPALGGNDNRELISNRSRGNGSRYLPVVNGIDRIRDRIGIRPIRIIRNGLVA